MTSFDEVVLRSRRRRGSRVPELSDQGEAEQRLSVATTADQGVRIITVSGEIDHQSGAPLRESMLTATAGQAPRVVVDLAAVTFMDSAGLNILLLAHRRTSEAGGWLRLAGAGAGVRRVLQIVGVDTVLHLYPDVATAVA
ncbi:STAS domain-containing protein [Streptomyces sp. NPDC049813]|uniref:STAS domain-containing protein n=1 Tax=Streptomyces sp. NPDC049813 TaxID=3365597 RepID=UPI0037913717